MLSHRDANGAVGVLEEQLLGQSRTFLAEHNVNLLGVGNIRIKVLSLRGKIINFRIGILAVKIIKSIVIGDI